MSTIAPVDSISGAFGKMKANICKKTVIANVRRAPSATNRGVPYQFFSVRQNARSTAYSEGELAAQTRFGQICVKTNERLNDASQQAADVAAFKAQSTYRTLRQYVWHQVAATIS